MREWQESLTSFVDATRDPRGEDPRLNALMQQLFRLMKGRGAQELDELMAGLLPGLQAPHPQVVGMVGLLAGCIVEEGAEPRTLAPRLLEITTSLLNAARRAVAATADFAETELTEAEGTVEIAGRGISADDWQGLVNRDPLAAQAYLALDNLCRPLIAALSRAPELLKSEAAQALVPALEALGENCEFGSFLERLLRVPIDEEWLIVDPRAVRGFALHVSGVANAFQVYALVHDALCGAPRSFRHWGKPVATPGPAASVLEVARGDGPQELSTTYVPPFTLFRWSAVTAQRAVPNFDDYREWYSNSAVPAELARFQGNRVGVIGDFNIKMELGVARTFSALKAEVRLTHELEKQRVAELLAAFAATPHPGHPVPFVGWP